jgi:hypothetical protein
MKKTGLILLLTVVLAACGNKPRVPDWQLEAHDTLERYVKAYFAGDAKVEAVEFDRARGELASTGQPALVARAELTRCAAQVASLVFDSCVGFEALRPDAPAAERAYADYLAGRVTPADVELLPSQHRQAASPAGDAAAVRAIDDPLSRLIAAGVLLRTGRADGQVLTLASDTASAQGWRRPLLAWLGVQAVRAEQAGAIEEAQRLRRRIALVSGGK